MAESETTGTRRARRTARARAAGARTPSRTTAASWRPPCGCSRRIPTPASTPSRPPPASAAPTVYRHFHGRRELVAVARRHALDAADANEHDALRPAGELGSSGPSPLDVADVLNKVPPHLLGEQIVAEAQRIAGVSSVALYLVDIDGSRLLRTAGSPEFPDELAAPLAVGPEIPRSGIPGLRRLIERELPGSVAAPLYLRGRAIGLLLAVRSPHEPLAQLARQAAAALELARAYTDVFDLARRRKDTSAAAEVQQATLPPRIARISGAALAGNVLPSYDVGGDWFDYVENPGGTWLGIADAIGKGATAAALAAIALGAFRAARRTHDDLRQIVESMHETLGQVGGADDSVAVTIARWHGASSTLSWISCGNPRPDARRRRRPPRDPRPPVAAPRHTTSASVHRRAHPPLPRRAHHPRLRRHPRTPHRRRHPVRDATASATLPGDVAPTSASGTVKAIEDAVLSASSSAARGRRHPHRPRPDRHPGTLRPKSARVTTPRAAGLAAAARPCGPLPVLAPHLVVRGHAHVVRGRRRLRLLRRGVGGDRRARRGRAPALVALRPDVVVHAFVGGRFLRLAGADTVVLLLVRLSPPNRRRSSLTADGGTTRANRVLEYGR